MASINKAENMVGGWLKSVPHLPKGGQKWIAENAWWIVLIGVIASAIAVLTGIGAIFAYMTWVGNTPVYSGYYVTSPYGAGWIIGSVVSLLFSILIVILLATAITPLKALKKKGWDRLFLVLVVDAVSAVVGAILSFSILGFIFGIVFGAIGLAISAYFTFEVRSYFGAVHTTPAKTAKK
ncbi:hypothetical protein EPN95_02995 [Patescibacteria group bacterium]|nr:MAG: hypothetical protein EPN95_02995 [Patescibacteria group bacterium]